MGQTEHTWAGPGESSLGVEVGAKGTRQSLAEWKSFLNISAVQKWYRHLAWHHAHSRCLINIVEAALAHHWNTLQGTEAPAVQRAPGVGWGRQVILNQGFQTGLNLHTMASGLVAASSIVLGKILSPHLGTVPCSAI